MPGTTPIHRAYPHAPCAGCPPPYIVKPVVACGTADSHSMALVLWAEALAGLPLPLPAVVQEFVNHDALIHKVYVAGDKVRARGGEGVG